VEESLRSGSALGLKRRRAGVEATTIRDPDHVEVRAGRIAPRDLQESEVQKWNAVAAGWARWQEVFEHAAQPVSDRLVELAGVAPGHTVLDVATGAGEPAITAARRVGPYGRVIATDFAPAMLREASAHAQALGLSTIEFREMDAETPDIGDVPCDAILCRWGLMFVPDLEGCLRRLLALLRPGGRFAAAAWGAPNEVPFIQTAASVLAERAPLPDAFDSRLNAFRLSEEGLLADVMKQAGFADVTRDELLVTLEFSSAEEYTRFRRDITNMDAMLAKHHSPDVVEAAWRAVTKAARVHVTREGGIRFINKAVCFSGRR
jgi:ubiquinone/menaquinone biosynthesis C-methylase UbiE